MTTNKSILESGRRVVVITPLIKVPVKLVLLGTRICLKVLEQLNNGSNH